MLAYLFCAVSAHAGDDSLLQLYNAIGSETASGVKAALAAGVDWTRDGQTDHRYFAFHFAVGHTSSNGIEILSLLLASTTNVDARAEYRQTPLHLAARTGNTAAAKLLIEHGADVNARQGDRKTPLHLAAAEGNLEVVKLLIDNKVDVRAKDSYKNTPLMCAVVAKRKAVERYLRQHGARE